MSCPALEGGSAKAELWGPTRSPLQPGPGAIAAHLQSVPTAQAQLLLIVGHGPVVVLHVSQGGGQGHVDDGQLGPWPAQQLCEVQLQRARARPGLPESCQPGPSPPSSSRLGRGGTPASGRPQPPWGSPPPWRTGPPAAHRCPWRPGGRCPRPPAAAAAAAPRPALQARAPHDEGHSAPLPELPLVSCVPVGGPSTLSVPPLSPQ